MSDAPNAASGATPHRLSKFAARPQSVSRRRASSVVMVLAGLMWMIPAVATTNDPGAWLIVSTSDVFRTANGPSRWQYSFDAQARYFDLGSGTDQFLLRPAVGYKVGANLNAWLGYGRFQTTSNTGITVDENRYWQQLDWTAGRWKGGVFTLRARLEQRSLTAGDDIAVVLRMNAKYVRPVGDSGTTSLVLGLEPFFDLRHTDWGGASGINQNRVFIGISKRFGEHLSLEIGYMNQLFFSDNGEDSDFHLGIFNFKVKL